MSKKATLFINEHLMKHCWKNLTELTEILWDPITKLRNPEQPNKGATLAITVSESHDKPEKYYRGNYVSISNELVSIYELHKEFSSSRE